MAKNVTPNQLALYASLWIGAIVSFLAILGVFLDLVTAKWYHIFMISFLTFLCSYFIIINALKRYIYRKIKLIYKNIHRSKRSSKDKTVVDLNQDIIGAVEQEVTEWADSQQKEIDSLKLMEQYRRDFMGDISHELKTPIFSIQGYLHTLLDGALHDESINEKYIRKAAKNADRLQTIVEDLEEISRLESGKLILDIQPFDIKLLTEEVFDELEFMANKNQISLHFKSGADNPFQVKADRNSIRQVLVNLITNSIKYGVANGHTKISFYDMANVILIEVADNGVGIAEDHLNHLFDRFYRVDKSRARIQGGSGLGLSIVKHIIEAHQQTINVRSTENEGSTFGFTLEKA